MSKKTFKDVKKPARQPTPDEIEAFEDSGVSDNSKGKTQKSANTESRENRIVVSRDHANTDRQKTENTDSRDPENAEARQSVNTDAQKSINDETSKSVNKAAPVTAESHVRLTIDLPESDHRRFKTACAMTRRKMVQEVRVFIERRTAELEYEAGIKN